MTTAITQAVVLGARTAVCASTGNTSASLAAYAGRAGLQSAVLLPRGQISSGKLAQSLDYGALVCEIDGNFDDCMRLIQELGDDPSIYVANSINPFRIEGQKTVAFELMEQCLWQVPDHVVVPGGNMGNSTALGKGFQELLDLGMIERLPKLSVIQAEGAAPVARLFATLDLKQTARRRESAGNDGSGGKSAHAGDGDQNRSTRVLEESAARGAALGRENYLRERAGNRRREGHDRPRRYRLRAGIRHYCRWN